MKNQFSTMIVLAMMLLAGMAPTSHAADLGALINPPAALGSNAAGDTGEDASVQLATDGAGHWVAVWHSLDDLGGTIGTDQDILVATSSNDGATWSAPAALNSNAASDTEWDYAPRIATDRSGNWIVVWETSSDFGGTGADQDLLFSVSTDNGANWSAAAILNDNAMTDSGQDQYPRIATDANGTWLVSWHSNENIGGTIGSDYDLLYVRSTDNGANWTSPQPLNGTASSDTGTGSNGDYGAEFAADGTGNWVVVWFSTYDMGGTIGTEYDILYSRSTDGGASWFPPAMLNSNAASDSMFDEEPQIATDGAGNWIAVWKSEENLGGTIGTDYDLLFSRSTDNGQNWTAPAALNANAASDSGDDYAPRITIDNAGNWLVAWNSTENLGGVAGTDWDILITRSTDNGQSWSPPGLLNTSAAGDTSSDEKASIAYGHDGKFLVAWQSLEDLGGIGTDSDILFAEVTLVDLIVEKIHNPDEGSPTSQLGYSICVDGDTMVVGAHYSTVNGLASAGNAFVYRADGLGGWTLEAELIASDAAVDDNFGKSVSISGDTVIVGAAYDDDGGSNSGSAYVFVRSGGDWTQQAKLTASGAAADDYFGWSVSISGDTVIVGAQEDDDGGTSSGSAFIFTRSGTVWSQQAKLTASDAAWGDRFGQSVSISGDTVIVGAPYDDDGGVSSGSAYVFKRSGTAWTQQAKLTATDTAADDEFGKSVSISGDTAVIGAVRKNSFTGSAYVFTRSGSAWTQQAKLTAADAAQSDFFGNSVSVSGDTILIGAYGDNMVGGSDSGSAYVFIRSGSVWSQQAKLKATDRTADDYFGSSVSVSGDTTAIGAYRDDDGGSDSGSAYVFTRSGTTWTQRDKISFTSPATGDYFGRYVAASGDTAIVGAPYDDPSGANSGSAYVYTKVDGSYTIEAQLVPAGLEAGDTFGWVADVDGDTAVVSAHYDDDGGSDAGAAYVFVRSGGVWTEQAKLVASDAAASDEFGYSVAISGDMIVVGSRLDDDGGSDSGSAYVFTRSGETWTEQAKLTASDAAAWEDFGFSVAIDINTILVGAYLKDDVGSNSGAVYVYVGAGSSWTEQAKLTASDAANTDRFGNSVAISGDTAIIGTPYDDDVAVNAGSAYVFTRTGSTWSEQAELHASDGEESAYFGISVSIVDDRAIVGARLHDAGATDSGAAYIFERSGDTWSQQGILTASDGAASDELGRCVATTGNTFFACAHSDDDPETDAGSVYVYTMNYTVNFEVDASGVAGSLTGDTPQSVVAGDDATAVTAVPDGGAYFVKWTLDGADYSTDNPLVVTNVQDNMTLKAVFENYPAVDQPQNPAATGITVDSIDWTWTDATRDALNYYNVYFGAGATAPGTITATEAYDADTYPSTGLAANAQYAFQVEEANDGTSGTPTATITAWTLIEPVAGLTFSAVGTDTITVAPTNTPSNLSAGTSGLMLANTTAGTDGGWQQDTAAWVSGSLSPNTQYSFSGTSRNGASVGTTPATDSQWTLIEPVAGLTFSAVGTDTITVAPTSTPSNLSAGTSGLMLANTTAGTDGGWQQNADAWVSGSLSPNTQYSFSATSRNGASVEAAPATDAVYTLALAPVAPVVDNPTTGTLDVTLGTGDGNPAATEYAIYCTTLSQWVQPDGSLAASPAWQTAAVWATVTVEGLESLTEYGFTVTARNGDGVETTASPEALRMTLYEQPEGENAAEGWERYE